MTFMMGTYLYANLARSMFFNLNYVIEKCPAFLVGYFGFFVLCSLIFCYVRGPIKNPRAHRAIEFVLKLLSFFLAYISFSNKLYFAVLIFLHFAVIPIYRLGILQYLKKEILCMAKCITYWLKRSSCFVFQSICLGHIGYFQIIMRKAKYTPILCPSIVYHCDIKNKETYAGTLFSFGIATIASWIIKSIM